MNLYTVQKEFLKKGFHFPVLGLFLLSMILSSCSMTESPNAMVNLVLEEGGKKYAYTHLGSFLAEEQIKRNESPTLIPTTRIFEDEGKYYVAPTQIKAIAELMSGQFKRHDFKDASCDGYLSSNDQGTYQMQTKSRSTGKIGEQEIEYRISLKHPEKEEQMEIVWYLKTPGGGERIGQNCEKKSLQIIEHPYPGKTVLSSKEFLLVDLNKIRDFFDQKISLKFDQDQQLLTIQKN
ncbi:MAG: hypothetical protein EP338_12740 [Bacteroidetes bacterium]|nr:MAG: hypothetical protein EP338_12740 [Bacteroidota bacterium]